jgi:hypothetical protein
VKIERWNNLLGKNDADVPIDVIRASIHQERDKLPKPIWIAWKAPKKFLKIWLSMPRRSGKVMFIADLSNLASVFANNDLVGLHPNSSTKKPVIAGVG